MRVKLSCVRITIEKNSIAVHQPAAAAVAAAAALNLTHRHCCHTDPTGTSSSSSLRPLSSAHLERYATLRSTFLQCVNYLLKTLAVPTWSSEVEQALQNLPFQLTADHVLEVLKRKQHPRVVLCFFLWVRRLPGFKHNHKTYNTVVHLVIRAKEFRVLEEVFRCLEEDHCVLGTITCDALIQAYGSEHMVNEAFDIFSRMDGHAFYKPNIWTCNILLHILIKEDELDWAHDFYQRILNAGFKPNIFTCNIWMLYLCRQKRFAEAFNWLQEMPFPPNFVSYSTLIDGLCKAGKMVEAKSLFDRMVDNDMSPDVVVFSSLIDGYAKVEMLDEAWKLFRLMEAKGVPANIVTYTSLIDSLLKSGETSRALELLEFMQLAGCAPNTYLCTARIDSLCKLKQLDEARSMLNQMEEVGCKPNTVTYCALIDGHLKAHDLAEAMALMGNMRALGCKPNAFLYASLVYSFGKSGDYVKAKLILDESLANRHVPDTRIMNCWMSGLCRAAMYDDAHHLFVNLKAEGFTPNTVSYNILLTAFSKSNRVGYARLIFEQISESNCLPDRSSYTNLMKGFCKTGAVSHASNWLVESSNKGFVHIFRFHVYAVMDIFNMRNARHARSFLKLLGTCCTYTAEEDKWLFFQLLVARDANAATKALISWKKFRKRGEENLVNI